MDMEDVFQLLGVIAFAVLVTLGATLVYGWILVKLWFWFMVPIFHLAPLRLVEAIGIMVLLGFLRYEFDPARSKESMTEAWKRSGVNLLMSFVSLGFGYIVHRFM